MWFNLSWDPQETWEQIPDLANPDVFLGGNSYAFSILFTSDSSVASEGFHADDFVHFGVSRVTDYTVDMQCDNPPNGYTVAPNQMASLYCTLTNNGYAPATIRLQTNVTNDSWMFPYPVIRMDIEGSNNHGTNVVMPPIGAGKTIEFWPTSRFLQVQMFRHKLGIFGSRMPAALKPARKHGWPWIWVSANNLASP